MQLLSRKGIGMPVTAFAHSTKMKKDVIRIVGGAPLVIKLVEGTQGKGVILADTDGSAEALIEAFRTLDAYFLVQEYIGEAKGSDIRVLVVGNKVVASMVRQARPGEFRSNLHRGGTATVAKLSPEERKAAIRAAEAIGLNVAGVDIIRSNHGPLILEVNSSPGLEGIEGTSQKDVAGAIIEYIEKNAKPGKNKTKGKG
jgi:ribosomal protein S6--L-glutamate ligase